MLTIGASNLRQPKRLWPELERPGAIKRTNDERGAGHARQKRVLAEMTHWAYYAKVRA